MMVQYICMILPPPQLPFFPLLCLSVQICRMGMFLPPSRGSSLMPPRTLIRPVLTRNTAGGYSQNWLANSFCVVFDWKVTTPTLFFFLWPWQKSLSCWWRMCQSLTGEFDTRISPPSTLIPGWINKIRGTLCNAELVTQNSSPSFRAWELIPRCAAGILSAAQWATRVEQLWHNSNWNSFITHCRPQGSIFPFMTETNSVGWLEHRQITRI